MHDPFPASDDMGLEMADWEEMTKGRLVWYWFKWAVFWTFVAYLLWDYATNPDAAWQWYEGPW